MLNHHRELTLPRPTAAPLPPAPFLFLTLQLLWRQAAGTRVRGRHELRERRLRHLTAEHHEGARGQGQARRAGCVFKLALQLGPRPRAGELSTTLPRKPSDSAGTPGTQALRT